MGSPPRVREDTPKFCRAFWRDHSEYNDAVMRGVASCRCCFQVHVSLRRMSARDWPRFGPPYMRIRALWRASSTNLLRSIAHVRERAQAAVVEFGGPG